MNLLFRFMRFMRSRGRLMKLMVGLSVIVSALCWLAYPRSDRSSLVKIHPDLEITVITRPKLIRDIFLHKPELRNDLSNLRIVNTEAMLLQPGSKCHHTDYAGVKVCTDKWTKPDFRKEWSLLKFLLEKDQELNLIDFNTGPGVLTVATAKLGRHVFGIDATYDNILLLSESIRVNDVTDKVQLVHSNVAQMDNTDSVPRILPDMITNEILFQKAGIKVSTDMGYDENFRKSLVDLLRKMDIAFIMAVGRNEGHCDAIDSILRESGLNYKIVDRRLKYNPSGCMDPLTVWVKELNENQQDVPKDISILNPSKVESLVNYVKCITMAKSVIICVSTHDTTMAQEIQKLGYWKPHWWNSMEKLMDNKKDLGLIDIGAHIGEFTLLALAKGRQVLAVESLYENIQRLCESVRVNKFNQANLKLLHTAVSDQHEVIYVWQSSHDPRDVVSTKTSETASKSVSHSPNSVIKTIRFDDLKSIAPQSAILRFDMKEFDLPVLKRLDALLNTVDVVAIFMERIMKSISNDWQDTVNLLKKSGYTAYSIESRVAAPRLVPLGVNELPQEIVWLKDQSARILTGIS